MRVSNGAWHVLREVCFVAGEQRQAAIETDLMLIGYRSLFPVFHGLLGPTSGEVYDPGVRRAWKRSHVDLPPQAELEVARAMRETHWKQFGWEQDGAPRFSDEAVETVRYAMALAVAREAPWLGPDHLLEALLAEPTSAASQYAQRWGVDLDALTEVAERIWPVPGGQVPRRSLARAMSQVGVLTSGDETESRRAAPRGERMWSGLSRLLMQTGPALGYLELEATAEAVRSGHDRVTPVHLLSAVVVLEDEMAESGMRPRADLLPACDPVLLPLGVDPLEARTALAATIPEGEVAPRQKRRDWRHRSENPPWTVAAVRVAEKARQLTQPAGSTNLLHAVLSDPDETGRRLLRDLSVDPAAVLDRLDRRGRARRAQDGRAEPA